MDSYKVLSPLLHDGKRYEIGDTVEMSSTTAVALEGIVQVIKMPLLPPSEPPVPPDVPPTQGEVTEQSGSTERSPNVRSTEPKTPPNSKKS